MIVLRETLEKMIDQADRKAERAYINYQETGTQRYKREQEKAEDLADTLRTALSVYDDHEKLVALKTELIILANDADNVLARGVVEDCEDIVIRFLHLAEYYCGLYFEGLPE